MSAYGLGCGCTQCAATAERSLSGPLGDFGWHVKTPVSKEGHEVLTRRAVGPTRTIRFTVGGRPMTRVLSASELATIIDANRKTDLGFAYTGTLTSLLPAEQAKHALRRTYGQSVRGALADIIAELRRQHAGILRETNAKKRLERVGRALHLVQDAYAPAHVERDPTRGWCITYIRNFGRGASPREHGKPSDPRDALASGGAAAGRAAGASRRYLSIVFKALWAKGSGNPAAVAEASREFAAFIARHFRHC